MEQYLDGCNQAHQEAQVDKLSANATIPPRPPREAKDWFPFIFVGLVLGVGGTVYYGRQLLEGITHYRQTTQLMEQGVIVDGLVTGKHSKVSDESTFYYVSYRFSPERGEGEIIGEDEVGEVFYGNIIPNAPVRIRYLKGSPEVSRLDTGVQNPSPSGFVFNSCLTFVFALTCIAFAFVALVAGLGPSSVSESG